MKGTGVVILSAAVIAFVVAMVVLTRPQRPEPGLTGAELSWVQRYEPWRLNRVARLRSAYAAATVVTTRADVAAVIRPLRDCARTYAALGPAPAALVDVDAPSVRACAIVSTVVARFGRSRSVADASRKTRLKLASVALVEARTRLLAHLRLARALPASNDASTSRVEPRLTASATQLVAANVDVRCWSASDWRGVERELAALAPERGGPGLGSAGVWSGAVQLSPSVCDRLLAIGGPRQRATDATVRALAAVGRVVSKASGTLEEASASCDGLQAVRPLATDLGAGAHVAKALAARAWTLYRARLLGTWSAGCRSGGALDRDYSNAWP